MKWIREIYLKTTGDQSKIKEMFWKRFPYAKVGCSFSVKLEESDPRIPEILNAFEEHGIPRYEFSRDEHEAVEYSFDLWYEYEKSDFDSVKYLELNATATLCEDQFRDSQMRLRIPVGGVEVFVEPDTKIGGIVWYATIVSDEIRRAMIAEGLTGIRFREVVRITESGDVPMPEFWEIYSDIILPPMPYEWVKYSNTQEPFTGDYSRRIEVRANRLRPESTRGIVEMHFHEEDVRDIEPFDAAMTHEFFEDGNWLIRRMVVSQRFRQFCSRYQLDMEWTPVRLDPGRHVHWKRPAPTSEPPLPHVVRWQNPRKAPNTEAAPKKLNILPRRHHRFFTREILPHMLVTSKRDELIPSLCASNSLKLLTEWWNLAGLKVSPPERIPEEGLEILSFEHKSCVCILMTFPPALAPGEAMLGMVMCGPLKRKNAAEIQAAPLRYYLMEQGDVAGESVLVDWKPPEVFETIGPGPKADWTKLDFTEAIFARNKL